MREDKNGSSYMNRMFGEFKALALGFCVADILCWHYILQVGELFVQYFLDPLANFHPKHAFLALRGWKRPLDHLRASCCPAGLIPKP